MMIECFLFNLLEFFYDFSYRFLIVSRLFFMLCLFNFFSLYYLATFDLTNK